MKSGRKRNMDATASTGSAGALIPVEDAQAALAFPAAVPAGPDITISAPQLGASGFEAEPVQGWSFGPVDFAIAGGLLALVAAVCIPTAMHFRQQANALDKERADVTARCRQMGSTLRFVENRRAAQSQFRRAVNRYVADVEARPIVPWVTAVGELSRRRPQGVFARRMSGDGPRFRVDVAAPQPELVQSYAQSLRESPYLDFAALPAGAVPTANGGQVVGRLSGE